MSAELQQELLNLKYDAEQLTRRIDKVTNKLQQNLQGQQQAQKDAPVWLNKSQAARYMGMSARTVRRLELKGKLTFTAAGHIHIQDLDRYFKSQPKAVKPSP